MEKVKGRLLLVGGDELHKLVLAGWHRERRVGRTIGNFFSYSTECVQNDFSSIKFQ